MTVTCVLISEGSSDLFIQRIVEELLHPDIAFEFNPGRGVKLSFPPKSGLCEKVQNAIKMYSPRLILVHRDADTAGVEQRIKEIRDACSDCVPVIPVRESEAWLLADREAICELTRLAELPAKAGYPRDVESCDAKKRLRQVLLECRLAKNWKRRDFDFEDDRAQLGRTVSNLDRLRKLKSFNDFEEALQNAIDALRP